MFFFWLLTKAILATKKGNYFLFAKKIDETKKKYTFDKK